MTRRDERIHAADDGLAAHDAFGAVLGFVPMQQTAKTACGVRRNMARIARQDARDGERRVTCGECLAELRRRHEAHEETIRVLSEELLRHRHTDDIRPELQAARERLTDDATAAEREHYSRLSDEYHEAATAERILEEYTRPREEPPTE
jgi:predicted phage gp36 major capsid-like protein